MDGWFKTENSELYIFKSKYKQGKNDQNMFYLKQNSVKSYVPDLEL